MKKIIKRVGLVLLVIILVVVLALLFAGGPIIKNAINTAGPKVMGVPVSVKEVAFAPLSGTLTLKGLHVGNPEGFKTPALFDMNLLHVELNTGSLLKDVIVVREVRIEAPEITYEQGLRANNIGALLDQMTPKTGAPAPDKPAAEPAKEAKGGKKVVIEKLTVSGARVHASVTAMGGHAVILPLPPLSLSNIGGSAEPGGEAKGVTFVDAIREVLGAILKSVTDVVAGAGKLAVEGAKVVGDAAAEGAKAVGGAATETGKAIGSGVGAVGDAVGEGAGKVLGGVKSLFGGDKEKKEKPPAEPNP